MHLARGPAWCILMYAHVSVQSKEALSASQQAAESAAAEASAALAQSNSEVLQLQVRDQL